MDSVKISIEPIDSMSNSHTDSEVFESIDLDSDIPQDSTDKNISALENSEISAESTSIQPHSENTLPITSTDVEIDSSIDPKIQNLRVFPTTDATSADGDNYILSAVPISNDAKSDSLQQNNVEPTIHINGEPTSPQENSSSIQNQNKVAVLPSLVFVVASMKKLLSIKDGLKSDVKPLLSKGLEIIESKMADTISEDQRLIDWSEANKILDGLELICEPSNKSSEAVITGLDIIEKLVSFRCFKSIDSYYSSKYYDANKAYNADASTKPWINPVSALSDRLIKIICQGFTGSSTPDNIQLQIVKAILAVVLSIDLRIHQDALLRSVRTVVNIYLLGYNNQNETISQAALSQMIHTTCKRAKKYSNFLTKVNFESDYEKSDQNSQSTFSQNIDSSDTFINDVFANDVYSRDVFLVFWALSKLSMRKSSSDYSAELKKISERSITVSLSLMSLMLSNYQDVFTNSYLFLNNNDSRSKSEPLSDKSKPDTTPSFLGDNSPAPIKAEDFGLDLSKNPGNTIDLKSAMSRALQQTPNSNKSSDELKSSDSGLKETNYHIPLIVVIKQYLSLSLSRSLVSTSPMVLGLSLEIFEQVLVHFRNYLKQEIEVLMKEIIFPILAMKHSGSVFQRILIIRMLGKAFKTPNLVVELYLNYDCDSHSQIEIFQKIVEQLCRTSGIKVDVPPSHGGPGMWGEWSNLSTLNQEQIEDNMWSVAQKVTSIFRSSHLSKKDSTPTSNSEAPHADTDSSMPDIKAPQIEKSISAQSKISENDRKNSSFSLLDFSNDFFDHNTEFNPITLQNSQKDEYTLRQLSLNALIYLLQSMVVWSGKDPENQPFAEQTLNETEFDSQDSPLPSSLSSLNTFSLENSPKDKMVKSTSSGGSRQVGLPTIQSQDDTDLKQLKENRLRKEKYARDIELFNFKANKGIESLISHGFISSDDPEVVSTFIHQASKKGLLNKVSIGEYLGQGDTYHVEVMHRFVDGLRFVGMTFTEALRHFLQAFRLPGESQKIDRFMLKFAERYIIDNKKNIEYSNADVYYTLAYSTIMLNTDQHSLQVRNKMTKEDFVNNNRGINNGQDIKREILEGIFDDIANNEIKLKDDPLDTSTIDVLNSAKGDNGKNKFFGQFRRNEQNGKLIQSIHEHSVKMSSKSEQKIREMSRRRGSKSTSKNMWLLEQAQYTRATRSEHISTMFAAIWAPVLAALSSPLQTSRDPRAIVACLIGLQAGIALSCRFKLQLERAAFVTSLSKFTISGSLNELGYKQIEATRALLEIPLLANDIGDGFEEDWVTVLQCISLLDRLQLLSDPSPSPSLSMTSNLMHNNENNKSDKFIKDSETKSINSFTTVERPSPKASINPKRNDIHSSRSSTKSKNLRSRLAKLDSYFQILAISSDKIFSGSIFLSGKGISDFVKALATVAIDEITFNSGTGVYNSTLSQNSDSAFSKSHRRKSLSQTDTLKNVTTTPFANTITFDDELNLPIALPNHNEQESSNKDLSYETGADSNNFAQRRKSSTNSLKNHLSVKPRTDSVVLSPLDHALLRHTGSIPSSDTAPRLYMLTRIVEIAYYNMDRIKFEWSHIWTILGDLFDRAGSHPDARVAAFALDSLRQLSVRFLELDELPHFQFQKQFLRPFVTVLEHQCSLCVVANGQTISAGDGFVKDLVIRCVLQLVEARFAQLKSGWRSVLMVSQIAALDLSDNVADLGFELAKLSAAKIFSNLDLESQTNDSIGYEQFCELIDCLMEFSLHSNRPYFSLSSIEIMESSLSLVNFSEDSDNKIPNQVLTKILESLNQIVLHVADLEVRSFALEKLFSIFKKSITANNEHLMNFFFNQIAFSLFKDLNLDNHIFVRPNNSEGIEMWISTTLIKALRLIIDLFVFSFTKSIPVDNYISTLFDILKKCTIHPNETLSRIGAASLQDFIEKSYKFLPESTKSVAISLISDTLKFSQSNLLFELGSKVLPANANDIIERKLDSYMQEWYFSITSMCILHLQLINSIGDLFITSQLSNKLSNPENYSFDNLSIIDLQTDSASRDENVSDESDNIYSGLCVCENYPSLNTINHFSVSSLLSLCDSLNESRKFANKFNSNLAVRRRLVDRGIMPQLPSLLKQETYASLILILILQKLFFIESTCPSNASTSSSLANGKNLNGVKNSSENNIHKKGYNEDIENRLIEIFRIVLVSYNFSNVYFSKSGEILNFHTTIPWPRSSFQESQFFSLKPATENKNKNSIESKLKGLNLNSAPIINDDKPTDSISQAGIDEFKKNSDHKYSSSEQNNSGDNSKADEEMPVVPSAKDQTMIFEGKDTDPSMVDTTKVSPDNSNKTSNKNSATDSSVANSLLIHQTPHQSFRNFDVLSSYNDQKNNKISSHEGDNLSHRSTSNDVGNDGDNDSNFLTAISDSHRLSWRNCILVMTMFLGKLGKKKDPRFKTFIGKIYTELIKSLSTASNSGDDIVLSHVQFLLICTSEFYGISDTPTSFI
ncbi:Protein transport protein sec71 [Smittium culicis]|uniref:Protein transport protein sec71 n=1 Tax=Smittium culicis TaxID=133412 RepID=A0A1R1YCE6_9FUNG|nr:Protein transport protein sec71 [Smittium culicis]